jgi:hypothetical protein
MTKDNKTAGLRIPLTPEQLRKLKAAALKDGLAAATWARLAVLKAIGILALLVVMVSGCAGGVAAIEAQFSGMGVAVKWSVAEDGSLASCDDTVFPPPTDDSEPVVCHWSCGDYHGVYESVWVTFAHQGGLYTGDVTIQENPVCLAPSP